MKASDFYFDLPEELIAQYPSDKRGESRLIVYNRKSGNLTHSSVGNITDFIDKSCFMVFNNTRVRKARIFGNTDFGGKIEFLLLKQITNLEWEVICSKSKRQKPGKSYTFPDNIRASISRTDENGNKYLKFETEINDDYLEKNGHIPLPPYIKREDVSEDAERYQTVYSEKTGSVAAPTAGLHFTDGILKKINDKGIDSEFVTLHVGMGTFQPLRTEHVEDHAIHEETYEITKETADNLNNAKQCGKKIIAVGTTSVRTLESSVDENGIIIPGKRKTSLYIYPGYKYKFVDHMFTNFHTPDSTLLLLVSAFAGKDEIKNIYKEAVKEKYRFFSYGDAMLLL